MLSTIGHNAKRHRHILVLAAIVLLVVIIARSKLWSRITVGSHGCQSLDPKVWGPKLWFVLHSMSFAYPEKAKQRDMENMRTFLNSLPHVLPCMSCRKNLKKHLDDNPPTDKHLQTRRACVLYIASLHDQVTTMIAKREAGTTRLADEMMFRRPRRTFEELSRQYCQGQ